MEGSSLVGSAPDGMPDPNLVPPQIARSGDPSRLPGRRKGAKT